MVKIRVRNLSNWAGLDFSFNPGDILDLDAEVAEVRIAKGLAELEIETASIEPRARTAILPPGSPKKPRSTS
jgi:hypothetical protein